MLSIEKNNQNLEKEKRVVLIMASAASFFVPFMTSASTLALPAIAHQFSLNSVMLSWIATSFILAFAMFLIPFSRAADIYGRKKVFLIGLIIFTVATLACGLSVSIEMLIASRFLQGIAAAMMFGTGVSLLTSVYPAGERGRALGINAAAVYCGLFLGPSVGGLLVMYFGWRSIFLSSAVLSCVLAVLTKKMLKGNGARARRKSST